MYRVWRRVSKNWWRWCHGDSAVLSFESLKEVRVGHTGTGKNNLPVWPMRGLKQQRALLRGPEAASRLEPAVKPMPKGKSR